MQILQEQISVHVGNTCPALNARTGLLVPYGYSGPRSGYVLPMASLFPCTPFFRAFRALGGQCVTSLNNTGSSARYSHLLIEEVETFTLQMHAKRQLAFI
jgi:hypothetical protein